MYIPTESLGQFFVPQTPAHVNCWPLGVVGFNFPPFFWLAFLQQLGMPSILFGGADLVWLCLLFFPLNGGRTVYLWQLAPWKSAVFGIYFFGISRRTFPEGGCHSQNPRPWELRCLWARVIKLKFQEMFTKRQHFSRPTLVPGGNQSLRASWLPGLWDGVECAWANRKGLESHYFFPLKPHTNTVTRLIPWGSTVHSWGCLGARRLHSQEGGLGWDPQRQGKLNKVE